MTEKKPRHEFAEETPERNFAIRVEEQLLWVSREVLAMYSPVFRTMFFGGNFRESQPGQNIAELPDKSLADVLELLRCLFAVPEVKKVNRKNVDILLEFCQEYEIADLKRRCVEFVQREMKSTQTGNDHFLDLIALACKHNLQQYIPTLIPKVAQLPIRDIEKYHARIEIPVLAAIYQAKARKYQAIIQRMPTWKMHQNSGFSERQTGQRCPRNCGCLFTSFCKKCSNWYCPNHMIGCTGMDGFQKCGECGTPVRHPHHPEEDTPDPCTCGYTYSKDLLEKKCDSSS